MKQQSNRHIQGHLWTASVGALPGEQSLTELNRYGMLLFHKNIIWNVLIVMVSTSK